MLYRGKSISFGTVCSRFLWIFSPHILFTFHCSREKNLVFLTEVANLEVTPFAPLGGLRTESISGARTLLEKFWQISLYLTDDAIYMQSSM